MKIARATEQDIEALQQLAVLIEHPSAQLFEQSALELSPKLQQGLDDTKRLDWLADPANKIGSVILPTECVEQHLDSMRDAIDAAMRIQAAEAV